MTAHPIQPSDRIPPAHTEAVLNLWKPQFQPGIFSKSVEWMRKATHAPYAPVQSTKSDPLRVTVARVTLVVAALLATFASVGLALVPLALLTVEWKKQETYCKAMVSWRQQNRFVTELLQEKQRNLTGIATENTNLQNQVNGLKGANKTLAERATGFSKEAQTAKAALKAAQEENTKLQTQLVAYGASNAKLKTHIEGLERAKALLETEKETFTDQLSAAQAQAKPKRRRNRHNKSPQDTNSASPASASSPALKQEPEVILREANTAEAPKEDRERTESPELKRPD